MNDNDSIIEIYSGDMWECQLLSTMLSDVGIKCSLYDTHFPYNTLSYSPQEVRVMILKSDYDSAIKVVNNFKKS